MAADLDLVSTDVAAATSHLIKVDAAGSLRIDPGPSRWWTDHRQYVLNAELVAALHVDAAALCGVITEQSALAVYLQRVRAKHGGALLTATPPAPHTAAVSSSAAGAFLGGEPLVPVYHNGCSVHCVRGVLAARLAGSATCSLPNHTYNVLSDVDVLPSRERLCFQVRCAQQPYTHSDYRTHAKLASSQPD